MSAGTLEYALSATSKPERQSDARDAPDELAALREISRIGISGLDAEELGLRFLELVRVHVPFDRGVVRPVDGTTGDLVGGVAIGVGSEIPLPAGRSATMAQVIALGRSVINPEADPEDPDPAGLLNRLSKLKLNASVTFPLLTDEAVVGIVTLRRKSSAGFSEPELDFLSNAAEQIGPSIDNARLLDTVSNLAAIVETSPDLICRVDVEGAIQYINPAGREMLAIQSDSDLAGMALRDIIDGPSGDILLKRGIPAALNGGAWAEELVAVSLEGRQIPVEVVIAANYHRNGSLLGVSVTMRDIELRKRAEQELQRLATTDTLTGLPNRRQLGILLDQANRSARRLDTRHALVYVDLDGVKLVNDSHGHSVGDKLIAAVGHKLRESVRLSDVVARVGGDEFNVILYDAAPQDAMAKANALLAQVADVSITAGSDRIQVTASAGVAPFPMEGATVEDITAFADVALYQAKDSGRNQARLYDPEQGGRELVTALQRTRTTIVDALDDQRIVLYRQPIVDLARRTTAMYEVLVRLEDADGRLMTPVEFIPDAESLDLIRQIDERVIGLAFDRWKLFDNAGSTLRLTLNVSARSLGAELAETIVQSAREKGVDPGAFIFEITETATLRSGGHAAAFVQHLTAAGFCLAIDDFGSGTTSIRQIRSLDFHFLKLDGSLVRNLKTDETDRAFVSALTALVRALGMEIVAEFVQDEESIAFLAEIGVGYGQGYYLGKPEPFPAEPL